MRSSYIILLSIVSVLFLFSCGDSSDENSGRILQDTLSYKIESLHRTFGECDTLNGPCAVLDISYPILLNEQEEPYLKTLNDFIYQLIINGGFEEGENESVEQLAEMFFSDYKNVLNDFKDYILRWGIDRNIKVIYNRDNRISLKYNEYSFLGGAHPNYVTTFFTFDVALKKVIRLSDLFKQGYEEELIKIGEKLFREIRGLAGDENLAEAGYWFENNEFSLNDNYALADSGIIFFFNSYEIGPYSMGTTELLIPYSDLQHIMK